MVVGLRILAISDTHIQSLDDLEQKAIDRFAKADLILHAGDYTGIQFVKELKELTRFIGVYGNMDPPSVRAELKPIEVVEVEGFRIGLIHPSEGGSPFGILERIRKRFRDVNIVVYGHTHQAKKEEVEGVIYVNPGSLTGAFPALRKTCAEITLGEKVSVEIIPL
jgi:putative phosphoesterase